MNHILYAHHSQSDNWKEHCFVNDEDVETPNGPQLKEQSPVDMHCICRKILCHFLSQEVLPWKRFVMCIRSSGEGEISTQDICKQICQATKG